MKSIIINNNHVRKLKPGVSISDFRKKYPKHDIKECEFPPSMDELQDMVFDGYCYASDGCEVETDGKCEHGHNSWLLVYGLI